MVKVFITGKKVQYTMEIIMKELEKGKVNWPGLMVNIMKVVSKIINLMEKEKLQEEKNQWM